ncbi:MAG: NUDIX domain-containing protein [Alphaproteobacteria bacterium]
MAKPSKYATQRRRRVHDGFVKVDRVEITHDLFSGGTSPVIAKEIVGRDDASTALVRHRSRGTLVFVHQFRVAAAQHKGDPWLIELCAGKIDPGETAEQAMCRELTEETGYEALTLDAVGTFFMSPGYTTERMHLFVIDVDGEPGDAPGDGHEDIELVEMTLEEALVAAETGRIRDAKTLLGLYWLANNPANRSLLPSNPI